MELNSYGTLDLFPKASRANSEDGHRSPGLSLGIPCSEGTRRLI